MNKSTSYDDETFLSVQGLLTIKILPEELEALQQEIIKLKEENEKLKEECGAMNIVEKLNKEFDEIQNKNIKLEKENIKKDNIIKEQENKLQILAYYSDFANNASGRDVGDLILWLDNHGAFLRDNAVIDEDDFMLFLRLSEEYFHGEPCWGPPDELQKVAIELEGQFDTWCDDLKKILTNIW